MLDHFQERYEVALLKQFCTFKPAHPPGIRRAVRVATGHVICIAVLMRSRLATPWTPFSVLLVGFRIIVIFPVHFAAAFACVGMAWHNSGYTGLAPSLEDDVEFVRGNLRWMNRLMVGISGDLDEVTRVEQLFAVLRDLHGDFDQCKSLHISRFGSRSVRSDGARVVLDCVACRGQASKDRAKVKELEHKEKELEKCTRN